MNEALNKHTHARRTMMHYYRHWHTVVIGYQADTAGRQAAVGFSEDEPTLVGFRFLLALAHRCNLVADCRCHFLQNAVLSQPRHQHTDNHCHTQQQQCVSK